MTSEEMLAEAKTAVAAIPAGRPFFGKYRLTPKELETMLIDAYVRGVSEQARRAIIAFAPHKLAEYDAEMAK